MPITTAFTFLDFGEGGAQRSALELWRAMGGSDIRPVLVCARGDGALIAEAEALGLPVLRLGRLRRPWDLGGAASLARTYRQVGARVVHVPLYSRVWPYARVAAALARVPLVVAHDHCMPLVPTLPRRLLERVLGRGVGVLTVAARDAERLAAAGVGRVVKVLPNAVDVTHFRPRDRADAREDLGVSPSRPLIVVLARLVPRKRHVDLLAAALRLEARGLSVDLAFIGDGPLNATLVGLATAAGLGGRVVVGGVPDVRPWLGAADVVALPSDHEGQPMAVLEAMAMGRVVVATPVGAVAETVIDGVTGSIVQPRRPDLLADAIEQLLDCPHDRVRMEQAARERAIRLHDARQRVGELAATYRDWLGEPA